jgi:ribonuclease HII
MADYDARYPQYGFGIHKGYGTPCHLERLVRLGPCPIHRRTFRGVLSKAVGDGR